MTNYVISYHQTGTYTVGLYDTLEVQSGGTSSASQIGPHSTAGGDEIVDSGGSSFRDALNKGYQKIRSGGTATSTSIQIGGSLQVVEAGGVAISAMINQDGDQEAYGTATGTTISGSDAYQNVYAGALVTSTSISAGGTQRIYDRNASATSTTVYGGGRQDVYGSATSTTVAGGTEVVEAGAKDFDAIILAGTQTVSGTATGAVVSGGAQRVGSGGTATGTVLRDGAQIVAVGGTARGTVISGDPPVVGSRVVQSANSCTQDVYGSATDTAIFNNTQHVASSGTATNTTIYGGSQSVQSGGTATGTVISGGVEVVSGGGTTSNTTIAGGLLDLQQGAITSGAIIFTAPGTLRVEAAVSAGTSSTFASTISGLAAGDNIDLTGFAYNTGTTSATVSKSGSNTILTVTDGGATETFTLANRTAQVSATNSGGHILLRAVSAVAPTISGLSASTATSGTAAVMPFAGGTVTDLNDGGSDTDTLTIVQSGPGTLSSGGNALSGTTSGDTTTYSLSGTAQGLTATLRALNFTGPGTPNTTTTTRFTLTDTNDIYAGSATGSTSVIDATAAVAPTVVGGGFTSTTGNAPVMPFRAASVGDPNANSTDTLTIRVQGGGTLSGAGLSGGMDGLYTLSGTAQDVTSALEALTFTPANNAPNTATTTTFTLTDTTTPGTSATNSATSVTDTNAPAAPTVTGGGFTSTTGNAPVMPFRAASVGDPNANSTDTLTIRVQGGGTLSGAGLSGGMDGLYTLSGTAQDVTSALEALTFTPANNAPNTATTTTFTLTDTTTPGTSATNSATSVTDTNAPAAPTVTGGGSTTTTGNAPVMPFRAASVGDPNANSTDTLTIRVQGGGTLSGAGLSGGMDGLYTLSGTAQDVTSALEALTFTPANNAPNTATTTTFTLTDTTTAGTSATNSATSVTDTVAAVAPTVTGGGSTSTAGNAPVMPFRAASVGDPNANSTDTLTIRVQGGGTLSGAGLSGGMDGLYTLSGTAQDVTRQLEALTFTPAANAPNTTTTTTFVLTDTTTPGTSATNNATSVTDTVAPLPPAPVPLAPDAISIASAVSYADGVFTLTGTASSTAGVRSVEITAQVDGVATDLGAATVNPNGTFTFQDVVGAHTQAFITATEIDGAGGTASAQAPYALTGGLGPRGTAARQDTYSADGSQALSSTLFRANGTRRVSVEAPGQTVALQPYDTVSGRRQGGTTFVYTPGGETGAIDVIRGFKARGPDHDVLSLKGADFGNSIANVLRNTGDVSGSAFITDPVTGDAIRLVGVSTAELTRKDFTFHT